MNNRSVVGTDDDPGRARPATTRTEETKMNVEEKPNKTEINVNGRPRIVEGDEVSFEEAVKLAFPEPPPGRNIVYTVAYRKAAGDRSGDLVKGQSVKVKEGTIFDVTATDKS